MTNTTTTAPTEITVDELRSSEAKYVGRKIDTAFCSGTFLRTREERSPAGEWDGRFRAVEMLVAGSVVLDPRLGLWESVAIHPADEVAEVEIGDTLHAEELVDRFDVLGRFVRIDLGRGSRVEGVLDPARQPSGRMLGEVVVRLANGVDGSAVRFDVTVPAGTVVEFGAMG